MDFILLLLMYGMPTFALIWLANRFERLGSMYYSGKAAISGFLGIMVGFVGFLLLLVRLFDGIAVAEYAEKRQLLAIAAEKEELEFDIVQAIVEFNRIVTTHIAENEKFFLCLLCADNWHTVKPIELKTRVLLIDEKDAK